MDLRKLLLCLLGVSSLIYAFAVLAYVYTVPDIGVRTAFDTTVKKFDGQCAPITGKDPVRLQDRDRIDSLGGASTKTWGHLLQSLNSLSRSAPAHADSLAQAGEANYVKVSSKRYVRVEFWRPEIGRELACWCEIVPLPGSELVPSILWFFLKVGLFTVGVLVFWKRPNDSAATQFF